VAGDHTYFIGEASGIWTHNTCVGSLFIARHPSGKPVKFLDGRAVTFTRLPNEVTEPVRIAFKGTLPDFRDGAKADFFRALASDPAKRNRLLEAGFSPSQIDRMRLGDSPRDDWQVHHKLPVEFGGTNDFENLILVQRFEHESLSAEGTKVRNALLDNESIEVTFPMFDGEFIHDRR
jgi:hypothetical protein